MNYPLLCIFAHLSCVSFFLVCVSLSILRCHLCYLFLDLEWMVWSFCDPLLCQAQLWSCSEHDWFPRQALHCRGASSLWPSSPHRWNPPGRAEPACHRQAAEGTALWRRGSPAWSGKQGNLGNFSSKSLSVKHGTWKAGQQRFDIFREQHTVDVMGWTNYVFPQIVLACVTAYGSVTFVSKHPFRIKKSL